MSRTIKALAFASASVLSVCLSAPSAMAAPLSTLTPAGTNIDNIGTVNFENDVGVPVLVPPESNLARVPVGGFNLLDLEDDRSVNANPGDSITFAHRLTNVGNQDDSYTLSVTETTTDDGIFDDIQVYLDVNGDGDFDLGEPLLTTTTTLAQNEFIDIVVIATIDATEDVGDTLSYTLTATSDNDGSITDSNLDSVFIVGDPEINLSKSSTRQCTVDVLTQVDGDFDYTIDFDNEGILSLTERSISVDGVGTDGVLIEDALDSRIELRAGQTITATPASAQFLVQRSADTGANLWITYGNWDGNEELAKVGLIFDAADLGVGDTGSVTFGVSILSDVVPANTGADIFNTATIDIDGDSNADYTSNQVCNELGVLEPNLDLTSDQTEEALPGATLTFDHVLTNTGELDDTYDLSAADVTGADDGDFDSISIFYVADGDGIFDDVLTTTPNLSPTDTLDIRVQVVLPSGAMLGESYQFTLTADSNHGNFGLGLSDTNTDTVNIIQTANLALTKTNTRQCGVDTLTQIDGDYSYTMSVTNNGDLAPSERSISVDAVSVDAVLVEDQLDDRIELLTGQTIIPSPAGAQFVVQRSADVVGDLWITYGAWNGSDELTSVGLLVDADDLEELESANATFGVRIDPDVVPADDSSTAAGNILNSLFVDLDGDNTAEFTSANVCNVLDVLEPALDLTQDRNTSALAGATVTFDHVLENTGELDDTYDVSIAQVTGTDDGDFDSIAVFYIADGDGLFNDVLTTTPTLMPNDTLQIRVEAVVPAGATDGQDYQLTITAESNLGNFGATLSDTNTDTLTVLEDVMIDITKANSRQCGSESLTQVDGDFTYSLTVNNSGDVSPAERGFSVNGVTVNGVLITDTLDSRIELLTGQTLNPTPAQFLVQRTLDVGSDLWISYSSWNGNDAISSIGLFADADDLEMGEGFNITFAVRIDPDVVPADQGDIFNTASVDLDGDSTAEFTSNQVCNRLDVLEPALDLEANQSANVVAGQTIEFTHTIENTGELDDSYDVVVQNTAGDDGDLTGLAVFYADPADGDGILNDVLTTTPTLMPGDTLDIRVEGTVPGTASTGNSIQIEVVATSNEDNSLSDTNTDTLTLIDDAIINLTKSNSTSCAVTLNQGASYDYTINFENAGDLAPVERSFSINTTPTDGVLIQDELATQLLLETGQTISPTPAAAQFVVQRTSDVGGNLWISYASWNGADALSSVGLLVDADDLQPGDSGSVTFSVQIDPDVLPANEGTINNQAFVDLDGDDTDNFESNTVCNTLDVLEPALDLTDDRIVTSAANLEVQFDHRVENTGELTDTYTLSVVNIAGTDDNDLNGLKLYHDLNNNDRFDTGEPEVSTTGALDPNDDFDIVIVGTVPPGVSVGDSIQIQVRALSTLDASLDDTNTDTVNITNGAVIQLVKSTTDACPVELNAGDTYTYTVNFSNTGGSPPVDRTVTIDGFSRNGVLIEDSLPVGTASLLALPTPSFTPAAARLVVQTTADVAASAGVSEIWTSYGAWNGTDTVERIGLFLVDSDLEPAESGTLSWQMEIDTGAIAGTQILNTAFVDLDNDDIADFSSNTVCNQVRSLVPGVDIRDDRVLNALAGATVEFAHTVENTGDITDFYNLGAINLGSDDGNLGSLTFYEDSNSDGILDAGEPVITVTPSMDKDDTYDIIVTGTIPVTASPADSFQIQVSAISDADGGVSDSNTDTVTLLTPGVDLTTDRIVEAQANESVLFVHQLENTGVLADSYNLVVNNLAGDSADLSVIQLIADTNGNGVVDAGETTIAATGSLDPNDTLDLIITGTVPGGVNSGDQILIEIVATSATNATLSDTNTDTINIVEPADLALTKTNTLQCGVDVLTQVDGDYSYTMNVVNTGDLPPAERSISVDGVFVDRVIVEDQLDSRIELRTGQTISPSVSGTPSANIPQFVVQRSEAADVAGDLWITYATWNGTDELASVGLLVDADDLEELESATVTFGVSVSSDVVPADDSSTAAGNILNSLFVDLDGNNTSEFTSIDVCNELNVLEPALDLTEDRMTSAPAGTTVIFDHVLSNTGELDDTYNISAAQVGTDDGDFDSITIYYVADGDGLFNDVLTTTPTLIAASGTLAIRVEALLPAGANATESYQLTITAESNLGNFGAVLSDSNTDTVTVIDDAFINLTKTNTRACGVETLTQIDGDFQYSIDFTNTGDVAPAERTLSINGANMDGVLISDSLDSRLLLSAAQTVPANFIVHETGVAANTWLTYDNWNTGGRTNPIDMVGLFVLATDMEEDETGSFSFDVNIDPTVVPADSGDIFNTAIIDIDGDGTSEFNSLQVCNRLDVLTPGLDLESDHTDTANAGETLEFLHTLTNTSALTDSYTITIGNSASGGLDYASFAVFYDSDTGDADTALDDPLTVTPDLAAGEVLDIRVEAIVPGTASAGDNYLLELTATSVLDPTLSDTNTDGVTIDALPPAVIDLTKSATRSCSVDTLTLADSDYSYSLGFTNSGGSAPAERSINLDGVNVDAVLIEDVLDNRLLLETGQTISTTPAGAQFVVQRAADSGADLWISYSAWNNTDDLSAVGLLVDADDMEVGETGSVSFVVSIDPAATVTTDIFNTAFVDLDGDNTSEFTSNQTCNQFSTVNIGVDVEQEQSVIGRAGDTIEFTHTVQNTGDIDDIYRLSVSNFIADGGDFETVELFYDADSDGQLDDPISQTSIMSPNEILRVRVVVKVADDQAADAEIKVTLLAVSTFDNSIFDFNRDTVEIPAPASFNISKTSDASCDSPLEPGDNLSYSVSFSNNGGTPMPISYSISGDAVEGIILEDQLPYSVQPTGSISASGTAVVRPFGAGWIYASDWNGTDLIQSVGSFMTVENSGDASSGSLSFGAFITETATNASELINTAFISTGGDEAQTFRSNSTCASVDAPAVEAQIRFLRPTDPIGITTGDSSPDFGTDEDFEDSEIYRINNGISNYNPVRDGVFIQVESTSISDETYTVLADGRRQVVVTINSNATGSTTQAILQETFPGSGTYRAIRPLILSTTSGVPGICGADNPVPDYDAAPEPECVLNAVQGDTLTVSLFDDGVGEILDDAAIVDPLGVVFDSVTRLPVAGAQVYVCAAGADAPDDGIEGDRCGPDAELAIDPFRFIEDGVNEPLPIQTTGDDGFYQYAFLLEGTYFMGVDAPSGYSFASGKEPSQFVDLIVEDIFDGIAIARFSQVFDASYGRDGFLSAVPDSGTFFLDELNPLIVIDLPVDPVEIALEVSSTCDVQVTTTDPVTYTLGYANVGNLTPTEKNISVDGSTDSGILFEDVLPFDVVLDSEQSGDPSPDGSIPLVQLFSDANTNNWLNLSSWDGSTPVARIGILVPGSAFGPGAEGGYSFDVTVSDNLTDQTVLENVLGVDVDGDGQFDFSAQADCDAVGPSAEIRFVAPEFDLILNGEAPTFEDGNDFVDTGLYRLEDNLLNYNPTRDGVYIELTSTSIPRNGFNVLPDGRRQIVVNVESALTGDTVIVVLHEVGFATGVYRSTRTLLLSGTQSANGAQCPSDARAAPDYVTAPPAECVLQSASNDVLTVTFLDPRLGITLEDDALVDPLGVVFDSQTLIPVEGAQVQIFNADGTVAVDPFTLEPIEFQTTGIDGFYQYPFLFPGTFYMNVVPPGDYSFPSAVAPELLNGQLLRSPEGGSAVSGKTGLASSEKADRTGTPLIVFDASYGQDGFAGAPGSGQYSLDLSNPLIIIDFPLDSGTDPLLTVEKSATRDYVELGGLVEYKVTVRNSGRAALTNVQLIDDLPFGFKYIKGTMHRAGELTSEPLGAPGPQLTINLGSLQIGESIEFSYVLQATAGAVDGDGINEAQATARFGGNPIASNVARFQVELQRDGVLSEKAVVFGKVYVDSDCNNIQSEGEWPIGGVKLYMENGTYVITDENGMYTLFGVRPGNHVLKIDPLTLPAGINLKPIDNRHGADPDSRFVDVRDGEYHRADFAASCPSVEQTDSIMDQLIERNESISGDWLLEDASRFNPTLNNNISDLALGQRNGGDLSSGILGNRLNQSESKDLRSRLSVATAVDGSELEGEALENQEEIIPDDFLPTDFPIAEEAVKTVTKAQAKEGTWLWPKDDISRLGRFMVVVRDGAKANLFLNGQPVSDKQLGEHFVNKREKAQVIAWYGLKLDDGINTLEVKAKDAFGNERVLAEKQFYRPGGATKMEVSVESDTLPADGGRSKTPVTIRLLDDLGLPARGVYYATVEVSDGFWEEEDLQDKIEGYQVRIQDGEATLHLRSSEFTGDVRIRVTTGIYEEETNITFVQSQRGLFATGILDAGTELCTRSGEGRDPADDFCKTADINTRAAFFLKGQVKGGYFLTMSYDSEKLGDEELLRDLNPNEFYPIMGDSSVRGYEAQSRSKLYAKIEYDKNSIAWGDFVTDVNTGHRDLGRVQRTLSGVQAIYDEGKIKAEVFGALVDDPRGSVEFAGNGTAMLYRIEQAPIVRNSEVVELVVRDRDVSGLVLESRNLQRLADYTIDYLSGDVRFVEAIPTFDENLNPVFVRISYDLEGDGNEELVAGVRGSYELVENLVVAGSYTTDENELNGYEILGTYLEYAPTDDMTIVVSAANMDHNDLSKSDGYALYSSIEMEWKGGSRSSATWGRAEQGFQNSSPVSADRQELKINHSQKLGKKLSLDAEVLSSETMSTGNTNDSVRISGDYDVAGWTITMGGRRIEQESESSDELGNATRTKDTATTIIAGAGRSFEIFGQSLNLNAEYERETGGQNRERWLINSTTSLTDKINLYGTFEQINSLSGINGLDSGSERINASFGFETNWLPSTSVYNEYRMRGVTDGRDLEAATGVRGDYTLIEGIQISPSIELINTLEGQQNADSVAMSIGIQESLNENRRSSVRLESRFTDDRDYYGMDLSYVSRLNLDWSAFVREDFRLTNNKSTDNATGSEDLQHILTVGLTHRPRETNDYHMISMYQWKEDRAEGLLGDRSAHLLSLHQNYQYSEDLTISSRVGAKYEVIPLLDRDFSSLTAVMDGRLIWDLTRRIDLDVHAGIIGTNEFNEIRYSAGVGVNYLVNKNLRVGVGYNLIGFDEGDLDPEGFNRHGIYLNAQYKFDEDLFFWLESDANSASRKSDSSASQEAAK